MTEIGTTDNEKTGSSGQRSQTILGRLHRKRHRSNYLQFVVVRMHTRYRAVIVRTDVSVQLRRDQGRNHVFKVGGSSTPISWSAVLLPVFENTYFSFFSDLKKHDFLTFF